MRKHTRLVVVALAATALLGMALSTASARKLSFTERDFESIWTNQILGATQLIFEGTGRRTACNVTLLGALHERTIPKVANSNIGSITHGGVESCSEGGATILNETLPWQVDYTAFTGTLPAISSLKLAIIGMAIQIREAGEVHCLLLTTATNPVRLEWEVEAGGGIPWTRIDETATIPLRGEFFCTLGGNVRLAGRGIVRNFEATAKVTVDLI